MEREGGRDLCETYALTPEIVAAAVSTLLHKLEGNKTIKSERSNAIGKNPFFSLRLWT